MELSCVSSSPEGSSGSVVGSRFSGSVETETSGSSVGSVDDSGVVVVSGSVEELGVEEASGVSVASVDTAGLFASEPALGSTELLQPVREDKIISSTRMRA